MQAVIKFTIWMMTIVISLTSLMLIEPPVMSQRPNWCCSFVSENKPASAGGSLLPSILGGYSKLAALDMSSTSLQ